MGAYGIRAGGPGPNDPKWETWLVNAIVAFAYVLFALVGVAVIGVIVRLALNLT